MLYVWPQRLALSGYPQQRTLIGVRRKLPKELLQICKHIFKKWNNYAEGIDHFRSELLDVRIGL